MAEALLTVEELQALLDPLPHLAWLGVRVVHTCADEVRLEAALPPAAMGNPDIGAVHGGVVASLVDIVSTCAMSVPSRRRDIVTIDMRVDFHRPAFGDRFMLRGWIVNQGRTVTVCQGEVRNPEGKLIASGRVLAMFAKL